MKDGFGGELGESQQLEKFRKEERGSGRLQIKKWWGGVFSPLGISRDIW